jgi:O-antigen ligase
LSKKKKHLSGNTQTTSKSVENPLPPGLFCLLVFILPLMVCPFIFDYSNLAQAVLLESGAATFAAYLVFRMSGRGELILPGKLLLIPLLAFLTWSLLSVSWACNIFEGIAIFLQWLSAFALFIVAINLFRYRKSTDFLMKIMFFSGSTVASIGILQYLVGLDWLPQEFPPAATFANRNVASEFIVICLPLGFAILFMEKSRRSLFYALLGTEAMLLFLFYSFTRSCLLAVITVSLIAFLVILILCIRGRMYCGIGKRHLATTCGMALIFIIGACLTPKGFDVMKLGKISDVFADTAGKYKSATSKVKKGVEFEKTSKHIESESVYFRLAAWHNALIMAKENPVLGVGLGNLKMHYPRYHRSAVYDGISGERKQLLNLHNDYLQVIVELGIPGFLLLLGLICAVAITAWKALHTNWGAPAIMPAALTASLICYSIVSFFGFPASLAIHPAYIALLVAGLVTYSGTTHMYIYKPSPTWISPAVKSAAILIAVTVVFCSFSRLEADKYFFLMAKAESESQFNEAILYGNKVLELDPSRKIVYSYLGRSFNSLNQPTQGLECLKEVLKYYPWHISALNNLVAAYLELGDYEKASEILSRGLSIAPESGALHNNLGNLLSNTGKNAEALPEFILAVKYDPGNPLYLYNKGCMELLLGRRDEAIVSFNTAARLRPSWELPQKQLNAISASMKPKANSGSK